MTETHKTFEMCGAEQLGELAAALEDRADVVSKALGKAWQLGQTYWQQADSEYTSQHRKADETQAKFQALVDETRAAILADVTPNARLSGPQRREEDLNTREMTWPETHKTFAMGDPVRKVRGSQWHGRVVGWYSTTLTPEGYAVESDREPGSVQIYPASALAPNIDLSGARMASERMWSYKATIDRRENANDLQSPEA